MIGQTILLNRRLHSEVTPGPKRYAVRIWLATSLPILLVEGFYLLLSYTDVLVLQIFHPSETIGIYYAVVKTLSLVTFIHFAMSAVDRASFRRIQRRRRSRRIVRPISRRPWRGHSGRRSPLPLCC